MVALQSSKLTVRVQISYATPIRVGSKSATASDCKSDSFGNSEIDTHPAHHFMDECRNRKTANPQV